MGGKPCWAGLDLASTRDLCAFRLLWRHEGIYYTWGRRWVPAWPVSQRTERGTVRYDHWVAAGYITQTDGDATDYAVGWILGIQLDCNKLRHTDDLSVRSSLVILDQARSSGAI